MSFDPDTQTIPGSYFQSHLDPPTLVFNSNNFYQSFPQKHLGVILDLKLTFEEFFKNVLGKVKNTVSLLPKLRSLLPRTTLITIYKGFTRPHLNYGDIL